MCVGVANHFIVAIVNCPHMHPAALKKLKNKTKKLNKEKRLQCLIFLVYKLINDFSPNLVKCVANTFCKCKMFIFTKVGAPTVV